jgi:hypothetical protein
MSTTPLPFPLTRLSSATGTVLLALLGTVRRVAMVIATLAVTLAACSPMVLGPSAGGDTETTGQEQVEDGASDDEQPPSPGSRAAPDPCRNARPPGPC